MAGSCGLWRPSWRLLGRLGGLLEPLWALLGGSGSLLGVSWAVLQAIQNNKQHRAVFKPQILPYRPNYGGRFGEPKSIKIGPKTNQNLRRFSRAKRLLFKSLLEPSWADLGALGPPKSCSGPRWRSFFCKTTFCTKSHLEAQLGRQKCQT